MAMSNFSKTYLNKSILFITILLISVESSISLTEILFEVGSLINIPCDIRSSNIQWYKDQKPVESYPGVSVDDSGNLKIQDADASHTGHYKCRNSAMDDDYSVHITVQDCGFIPMQEVMENGHDAIKTNHPWNAGIYEYEDPDFIHFCGGTLITPIIVISAGHCFKKEGKVKNKDDIFIGLGKGYRYYNDLKDINSAQLKRVTEIYISPHYDGQTVTYYSDIALLELKTPAKSTRYVQTACLDMVNRFKLNGKSVGSLVGWGLIPKKGKGKQQDQHVVLQEGHFPYANKTDCVKYLHEVCKDPSYNLAQGQFCSGNFIGDSEKASMTRKGDSGSGLIFVFNNKNYLFGVASTKIENYYVSLFTDVRFVANLEFIQKIIQFIRKKRTVNKGYIILPEDKDILANKEIGPVPTNNVNNYGEPGKAHADIVLQKTDFQAGEDIVIPCYVTGNPSPHVTWFKYDKLLKNSGRVRILRNNTLLLKDVDISDSGLYKCQAEYNFSKLHVTKSGVPRSYKTSRSFSSSTVYIYIKSSSKFKASDFMNSENNFNGIFNKMSDKDLSNLKKIIHNKHSNSKMDYEMPSNIKSLINNNLNNQKKGENNFNGIFNKMSDKDLSNLKSIIHNKLSNSRMDYEMPSNIKSLINSYLNNQKKGL